MCYTWKSRRWLNLCTVCCVLLCGYCKLHSERQPWAWRGSCLKHQTGKNWFMTQNFQKQMFRRSTINIYIAKPWNCWLTNLQTKLTIFFLPATSFFALSSLQLRGFTRLPGLQQGLHSSLFHQCNLQYRNTEYTLEWYIISTEWPCLGFLYLHLCKVIKKLNLSK